MLRLIRALSTAHTHASMVQAAAGSIDSLRRIEIGRFSNGAVSAWAFVPGGVVEHRERTHPPFESLPFSLAGQPLTRSRAAAALEAVRAGAASLWCGALGDVGGYVSVAFGRRRLPDSAALSMTAELLASCLRHIEVVSRVAELSRRANQDSAQLQQALSHAVLPASVVATSRAMREVVEDLIPLVARQTTTVLLRGETGTGKEVVARLIHGASTRANRPLLKANCGAIPENLVESVLFGHERGAFTGATTRHIGIFERANGGTLLLDEVAELPLAAQVKLLRVLQDGDFERVGGERTIHVDVRVIAATHRPLERLMERETFRADLYYRLNVFPISLPPLRERVEELGPLVAAIATRRCQRMGRTPPSLTAAGLKRLHAHRWPGNVRELENVVERALLLSPGEELVIPPLSAGPSVESAHVRPREHLDDALRDAIGAALAACDGRIFGPRGAAARLGIKPTTLQSKMKRLGISRSSFRR